MTKRFCDLCGKPAYDGIVGGIFNRGEAWRESRAKDGGCYGTWQCRIQVNVGFGMLDFNDDDLKPDLCADCIYELLDDVVRKLMPKPEPAADPDNLAKVEAALVAEEQAQQNQ